MVDSTHAVAGFIAIDGFNVTITGGSAGDLGTTLNWNGFFGDASQDVDTIITDVDDDGILTAGPLGTAGPHPTLDRLLVSGGDLVFSGYTITAGGVDYPLFEFFGDYYVPLPVDGTGQSIIPVSGTSNVFQASASDTFLCFGEGTGILTPGGDVAVEDLKIGDAIRVADGRITQVKWVGRQTVFTRLANEKMQPVRICTGALGDGLPLAELTVTADHGMVIDGLVINASALVNGSTIDWVPMDELPEMVTYYHIETEAHEVILANGAPAETFMDAAGRGAFDNHQEYLDLYGADRIIPEMPRPRINAQRLLPQAIKVRLEIGADALEFDLGQSA